MGKNKLSKFADMETFEHVVQAPYGALYADSHPLKGKWRSDFFKNDRPIVLSWDVEKENTRLDWPANALKRISSGSISKEPECGREPRIVWNWG